MPNATEALTPIPDDEQPDLLARHATMTLSLALWQGPAALLHFFRALAASWRRYPSAEGGRMRSDLHRWAPATEHLTRHHTDLDIRALWG
jgi:hypothetical protein